MKVLKWILIVVLALVALVLLWAAFLPSERLFEQSVTINKSARLIFKQVNSLKNWENWSPFLEADTAMKSTYSGPDYGVGASQSWISKVNGNGSMTILESIQNQKVVYSLDFGMGNVDTTWFTIEPMGDEFKLVWGTKLSNLGYPMGRIMGALMTPTMNQVFVKGLTNIKGYVEAMPADYLSGDISIEMVPARTLLAASNTVDAAGIPAFLQETYTAMVALITQEKLQFAGVPIAIYSGEPDAPEWVVTAAIPIQRKPKVLPQGYYLLDQPARKVVTARHFGGYDTVEETYIRIMKYINDNQLTINGDMWDEYISDPELVTDPMMLETKVYYPVE